MDLKFEQSESVVGDDHSSQSARSNRRDSVWRFLHGQWFQEMFALLLVLSVSRVLIFWNLDKVPGGLHWENYTYSFVPGCVAKGCVSAREMWSLIGQDMGWTSWYCAIISFLNFVFHTSWGTRGLLEDCGILALVTAGGTYVMARLALNRRLSVVAVVLLLSCPAFHTHLRSGNFQSVLNGAAGVFPVLFFLAAHKFGKPVLIILSSYMLALAYFATYSSFPMLLGSFCVGGLVGALLFPGQMLKFRWYGIWLMATVFFVFLHGILLSVFYCHQEPMSIIRWIESSPTGISGTFAGLFGMGGAATGLSRSADWHVKCWNSLSVVLEFFVRSGTACKIGTTTIPLPIWPIEHLGATVLGVPGVYYPVTMLLGIGVIRAWYSKKMERVFVTLPWIILLFVLAVVLTYNSRRLVFALPFMAVTAAFGYEWLEDKFSRCGEWMKPILACVVVVATVGETLRFHAQYARQARTLQFDAYVETGDFLIRAVNPRGSLLVLLDKSTMFPSGFYAETDFRPYRLHVMSEFYFPVLLASDQGNLHPFIDQFYMCHTGCVLQILRYCNIKFPTQPFDLELTAKERAWQVFFAPVQQELDRGVDVYVLASHAKDDRMEAGSEQLNAFLLREFDRHGVLLNPIAAFGVQPSGNPTLAIYQIKTALGK